jgi:hypothetical protein
MDEVRLTDVGGRQTATVMLIAGDHLLAPPDPGHGTFRSAPRAASASVRSLSVRTKPRTGLPSSRNLRATCAPRWTRDIRWHLSPVLVRLIRSSRLSSRCTRRRRRRATRITIVPSLNVVQPTYVAGPGMHCTAGRSAVIDRRAQ